jgi:hypothetical protein
MQLTLLRQLQGQLKKYRNKVIELTTQLNDKY